MTYNRAVGDGGYDGTWVRWTSYGLKKWHCLKGCGLCRFEIGKQSVAPLEGYYSPIYIDDNDNTYFKVIVDEEFVFEDENSIFYIEEELFYTDDENIVYSIPQGEYQFNPEIGELGGYEIPIEIE